MLKGKQGIANIILFMSIIAAGLIIFNNKVFADTEIKVYLNGAQLTYTDVQPQIISDRTMVPLSETAKHFNMDSTWDEDNATMYFNGNNKSLIHTVHSNVIYVDGRLVSYDFTSTIVNDRTLMPIRMIAEALDCEIEWIAEEKAVYITADIQSQDLSQSDQTQQAMQQTVEPIAEIYSASFSSSTVSAGDTAYMTVYGNFATTKVKVVDESGSTIAESSSYSTDESANYFSLNFALDTAGSHTLKVYGGTLSGYGLIYKTATLTVENTSSLSDIEIINIAVSDDEVDAGDEFTVTVKTSTDVAKVSIYDKNNSRISNKTSPSSSSSSAYTWKFTITEDDYTGTVKYYVYAYDDEGNEIYDTISVYVNALSSSSSSAPSISSIDYDSYYDEGDRITITVKTNTAVGYVSVIDPYSDEVAYLYSYSSKSGSYYYWELKFYFDEEGTYYIYAYDEDEDDYDRQKITLYFN